MIAVEVEIRGLDDVMKTFEATIARIEDLEPVFDAIGKQFYAEEEKVFDAEGGYGGRPKWKPLSEQYRRWKARHVPGAKILHLRGGRIEQLQPVSPYTGERRTKSGRPTRPRIKGKEALQEARGEYGESLRASLTDSEAEYSVYEVSPAELFIGSAVPVGGGRWNLAELHQFGTSRMPARPVITVTGQQVESWLEILEKFLSDDDQ
ncbi:MAG: hypothetical protein J7M26_08815 [Armatimonadetes bacterium]|nr:hypothetical protein [Armatimonadota bacterium]